MVACALACLILQGPTITRDAYGVPVVAANSWHDAFYGAGYAVAQDRLWQLENSRRLARGRMAEVFGSSFVASDREVLSFGYTDAELQTQFDRLPAKAKEAFEAYAEGVNAWIKQASADKALPKGYEDAGFKPEPWTVLDSAAVTVRLFQLFGRGGAGEVRNYALYQYLNSRANLKGKVLDVIDDLAWFDDPRSIPTVTPADDPLAKTHPKFNFPTRAQTEAHLQGLPAANLMELLPGIRLASMETSRAAADRVSVASKLGSYAVVVSKERSSVGYPLLLSAPQMGFRNPSVVHEIAIRAPGLAIAGMDVPGVPGVAIGMTPRLAWGLTSGVSDTEDIVYAKAEGNSYLVDGVKRPFETVPFTLNVKGGTPITVTQTRTEDGPVVIRSQSGYVFSRRSAYRMRELQSIEATMGIWTATNSNDAKAALSRATMNFNAFFATASGEIGYWHVGSIPRRAAGFDPRFPIPAGSAGKWDGFVPFEQLPHMLNPQSGLIANWNNKPASWWPNQDTPVWGRIFRNEALLGTLTGSKLGVSDLERAAWTIARTDPNAPHFLPWLAKAPLAEDLPARLLRGWDGRTVEDSQGALLMQQTLASLREEIFLPVTGNFVTPENFNLVVQPSLILNALEGQTKFPYLLGRKPDQVVASAFEKAVAKLSQRSPNPLDWRYASGKIAVDGQPPIPYSDRGTYIQIVELGVLPRGRNVVTPGVAEAGPHSQDQVPLARAWTYKPMAKLDGGS